MPNSETITAIKVRSENDFYYVDIVPPLSDEDVSHLDRNVEEVRSLVISSIMRGENAKSSFITSWPEEELNLEQKTDKAEKVAKGIADALSALRKIELSL